MRRCRHVHVIVAVLEAFIHVLFHIGRMHLSRFYHCRPWREWSSVLSFCLASAVGGQSGRSDLVTLVRPVMAIWNIEPGAFLALACCRTMRVVLARPYLDRDVCWASKISLQAVRVPKNYIPFQESALPVLLYYGWRANRNELTEVLRSRHIRLVF